MNRGVIALIIVAVVVGGALYYFNGGTLPSIRTVESGSGSALTVKSAQIQTGGYLALDILNKAGTSTSTIEVSDECSPDFSFCASLNSTPQTFTLPSGSEYTENYSLGQCGFAPNFEPCWGAPIPGVIYYFKVNFSMADGSSVSSRISAQAVGSFPLMNSFSSLNNPDRASIIQMTSYGVPLYGNLTGDLSVAFVLDRGNPPTITATLKDPLGFTYGMPGPDALVTITQTGYDCGFQCSIIVNQATQITLASKFSTVTTGVSSGKYYFVGIDLKNYGSYYLWTQAGTTTVPPPLPVTKATGAWKGYVQSVNFQAKYFNASTYGTTFTCQTLTESGPEFGVDLNIVNQGSTTIQVQNVTMTTSGGQVTLTPQGSCEIFGVSASRLQFSGFPHFNTYPISGQSFTLTVYFANGWSGTLRYKFS